MTSRALVTGCSSGFGLHTTRRLLAAGWSVVGVDRAVDALSDLTSEGRLDLLAADLADPAAIASMTANALAGGGFDLLVNNAGYAVFGTAAEADLDAIQRMFEVNVISVARVTQALLPSLRERRGTVVQISSVAGRMAFPESGFYAASKHAIEAMSESLFEENASFGLKVVVIEPGHFATGFQARASEESLPRDPASPYAPLHALWDARRSHALAVPPQDPARVAEAILDALDDPRPFLRVVVGDDAPRILALRASLGHDGWVHYMANRCGGLPDGRDPFDPVGTRAAPGPGFDAAVANDLVDHLLSDA